MPKVQNEEELIAGLVERFRVCWEVWPEDMIIDHEKRQVGFSLELYGTHEPSVEHPTAGCPHCIPVFTALQKIAAFILPKEKRPSIYRIEIYDGALHYTRKRSSRPEVLRPQPDSHHRQRRNDRRRRNRKAHAR